MLLDSIIMKLYREYVREVNLSGLEQLLSPLKRVNSWDLDIQLDYLILARRPDFVIKKKKR